MSYLNDDNKSVTLRFFPPQYGGGKDQTNIKCFDDVIKSKTIARIPVWEEETCWIRASLASLYKNLNY